ncbi:MAG: C45 family peptidase [Candidatus Bathyarchaeia archaeon]
MYHPRLSGTYYEMGFKHGRFMRRICYKPPKLPGERQKFAKECEIEVKRVFPEILEEFQGFADGCGVSYKELTAFIFTIGAEKHSSCSIFAASTPSPILGRNYDFYYEYKKYAETCLAMPRNAYWSVGNSTVFIGREDGLNECGLAVAMSTVRIKEFKPGINWFIAVRAILDKCSTVTEATKFLLNTKFSTGNNYLLVDISGDMVVVEASPQKVRVRKSEQSFLVATNHFMHPDMRDMENIGERPPTSMRRYNRIMEIIGHNDGRVTTKSAKTILADHKGNVCFHAKEIKLGTLWSMIACPSDQKVLIAHGHPCKAHYKEDKRLNQMLIKAKKNSIQRKI